MTLNVILCALLVSSPERTVWTLPRNDWWDVTVAIDINARPNEMFTLNLRMTKDTFMILCSDMEPHIQRIVVSADVVIFRGISISLAVSTCGVSMV